LLLFPVRSLVGVFAWTTSRTVLGRLQRDLEASGYGQALPWTLDNLPDTSGAWTVDEKSVVANGHVVLEEFSFKATVHADVGKIADWLTQNSLPQTDDYKYFREKLQTSLVILPEDAFRDFTQFATEIVTRIRIDQEKGTVAEGALWTEEHLPSDTVLYAPLHASRPRTTSGPSGWKDADDVLKFVRNLKLDRIQLGGNETVGRGIVKLHLGGGA
jgi:CRISPR-associated protein Cmr4